MLDSFKRALGNLRFALDKAEKAGLSVLETSPSVRDFNSQRRTMLCQDIISALSALEQESKSLHSVADKDEKSEKVIVRMLELVHNLRSTSSFDSIRDGAHELRNLAVDLEKDDSLAPVPSRLDFVPDEVRTALESDLAEAARCFEAGCNRSVVILCGRILEVALHRRYYDATGTDLLEKAPGTGLGNLIKKLAEKEVVVDPGLTNQIHMINQLRVSSVHAKRDAFSPTRDQAHAVMLYTVDALKRLFV